MVQKKILNITLYLLSSIALLLVIWWLMKDPTSKFSESLPGLDKRGVADTVTEKVEIGKIFANVSSGFQEMSEIWPRFRGNDFDNISGFCDKYLFIINSPIFISSSHYC